MSLETTKSPKILLVEDDLNLGFVIQDTLKSAGYRVHLSQDGKEGLQDFGKDTYDLCILDIMLPKKDGFSLAEDIRKVNDSIPIVFLTAKSMAEDRIKGFKSGGDDYVTKPFSSEELLLRIKAILRRIPGFEDDPKSRGKFQLGNITFDANNYELIFQNEEKLKLTKKESDLLKVMAEHKGQVLERELLANMVWGDDSYFIGRSMDVFMTKLRKYLSPDPRITISNVHGVGFRLEAP
jgi:DNA-binding response OmpR family regulator